MVCPTDKHWSLFSLLSALVQIKIESMGLLLLMSPRCRCRAPSAPWGCFVMFNLPWFSLLVRFAGFSFQLWTAPLWLRFTVKESLEKCQDSKWEQKFCISKGREVSRDGPGVLHYVELFPLSITEAQVTVCVSPAPFSHLFYGFSIFSALFSCAEICCLCERVTFFQDARIRAGQA